MKNEISLSENDYWDKKFGWCPLTHDKEDDGK